MAESDSTKCVKQCVELGEKTILPFVDDVITAVWFRIQQQSEVTEDKWLGSKKDFKLCKGFLNGLFKSSSKPRVGNSPDAKATSALLLATVIDRNAKLSTYIGYKAKPSELDTFRKRSGSVRTKGLRAGSVYSHPFIKRFRVRTSSTADEDVYPVVKILMRSLNKKSSQVQMFRYRLSKMKNLIDTCFGVNVSKMNFQASQRKLSAVDTVVKSALILNNYGKLINKRKGTNPIRPRSYTV